VFCAKRHISGAGPQGYSNSYDPEINLTTVGETSNPDGVRSYTRTYDARNRLRSAIDPSGHTVTYGYDAANSYDARNRLQNVTMTGGATAAYSWYADGLLQRVEYGAGMKRKYSYDNADRLTQVTNTTGADATPQTQEFLYGYDANDCNGCRA
jgi:YD repeat-containing protein